MSDKKYIVLQRDQFYQRLRSGGYETTLFVTEYGLNYLLQNKNLLSKKEQAVVDSVHHICSQAPTKDYYIRPSKNDERKDLLKYNSPPYEHILKPIEIKSYSLLVVTWSKQMEREAQTFTRVDLERELSFAKSLAPYAKDFSKICKKMDVTCDSKSIARLLKLDKDITNGDIVVRNESEALNKFEVSVQAFVVVNKNGCIAKGASGSLQEANLFYRQEDAERYYRKMVSFFKDDGYAVVSVNIALDKHMMGANLNNLNSSLAIAQKERLQKSLEELEVDQLRKRLTELEEKMGEQSSEKPERKRKL